MPFSDITGRVGRMSAMRRLATVACSIALVASAACSDVATTAGQAEPSVPALHWFGSAANDRSGPIAANRPGMHAITYTDVTGAGRTVRFDLRTPQGERAVRPVVVWSHGGGSGKASTTNAGVRWGKAINDAGLAFVAVAHPGRSAESRTQLCAALQVAACAGFKYLLWDRLTDVALVFDWLGAAASNLSIDMDRLVYGGHSAGAMSVMVMAGMESPYETALPMPTDDRPVAFIAASPPGAEVNGLTAASFAALDRPILLLTGDADTTKSTAGPDRLATFDLIESEQVMLLSTDTERAGHTTFDLNTAPCQRAGGSRTECTETVRALGKTAQVFLAAAFDPAGFDSAELLARSAGRLPDDMQLRSAA